jgi:hypothetical protein
MHPSGSNASAFLRHVFLPVSGGAAIYLLFRSHHLWVFKWIEFVGLASFVDALSADIPPSWLLFSLPDALWVYGLTSCMLLIWQKEAAASTNLWVFSGIVLTFVSEAGQRLGMVPGTFDLLDLVLSTVAFVAAYLLSPIKIAYAAKTPTLRPGIASVCRDSGWK